MKDELMNVFNHADDGAFIFNDREITMKGCRTTCDIMANWGLTVYVGRGKKIPKTELMHFSSAATLKKWRERQLTLPGNLDSKDNEVVKTARLKRVNFKSMHEIASKLAKVVLDAKRGTFNFTNQFVRLGANVDRSNR